MPGPGGCLVPGGVWSAPGGGVVSQHVLRQTATATAADGTHPTGMHSCWVN